MTERIDSSAIRRVLLVDRNGVPISLGASTHDELTGVTADQHHAQAHTLTSHSSRAHSELTGIGATDHHSNANDHVELHTLTSHSTRAHSELTGIGASDHHSNANDHPQSHTHASHTGIGTDDHHAQSHSHASHTGIGADDHHTQAHSITGADHTGFPGGTTTFLRADATFAAAGGSGADPPEGSYAPGSYTIAAGKFRVAAKRQQFTTTQRLTIQGTGRLSLYN